MRRLELFDRQSRRRAGTTPNDLSPHTDLLAYKIGPLQGTQLCSTSENERMFQARHIQFQASVLGCESTVCNNRNIRCRESGIVNRLGNQDRIEGFSRPRVNCCLAFHQIDISMTNAIQALQGLFGPFGSKPSNHAVDSDRGANHLRRCWHCGQQAEQRQ